ncbi:hypothetical protein, partial [Mesorhizobium sp. IMUNJ 23232]|uniref:hypothetical protein n=1 Tax=Mesorhizobium sp. IMUNJ 23232 TaxID=3376064 RepID=UPI0037997806
AHDTLPQIRRNRLSHGNYLLPPWNQTFNTCETRDPWNQTFNTCETRDSLFSPVALDTPKLAFRRLSQLLSHP